jgi:UDP-arabinose 4-epimerase
MKAALGRRGPLRVFGTDYPTPDGTAIRDYVHVIDLAGAHVRALEYLEGGGATTVLDLATGVGSSVLEVLAAAERVIGRPVSHEVAVAPRRPGAPVAFYADTALPREVLGWTTQRGLDEMSASAEGRGTRRGRRVLCTGAGRYRWPRAKQAPLPEAAACTTVRYLDILPGWPRFS